jgi:hypothetical protein
VAEAETAGPGKIKPNNVFLMTDVLYAGMSFFMPNMKGKQTMSNMKATDKQAMEILKKLDELIDFSVNLESNIDESESIEEVLLCLEDTIDEFCDAVEVIEAIREFLIEVENLDDEDPVEEELEEECTCCAPQELRNELIRIAQSIQAYERMAAKKRRSENTSKRNPMPEIPVPEEDSVALLFYDAGDYRVFPFEHVFRICPWLNEHSVMRAIPGVKDLYYLYEEGTEIKTERGLYLVGPIVVIRLNADHFLITPDALDRHRVRKFMRDNTETIDFEEGASYPALRFV